MPRKIRFTIFNETTGEIRCTGVADPDCVDRMVRAGEAAIKGRQGDPVTQRVVVSRGNPSIRKRAAAEIEARMPRRTVPPPSVADILEALRHKGLEITRADLEAAAARRAATSTVSPP